VSKHKRVGGIGWGIPEHADLSVLHTGQQIQVRTNINQLQKIAIGCILLLVKLTFSREENSGEELKIVTRIFIKIHGLRPQARRYEGHALLL